MKRRKLKQGVWISLYLVLIVGLVISAYALKRAMNKTTPDKDDNYQYVSSSILDRDVPVINEVVKIIKPFNASGVSIAKTYYDYQADATEQEKSIVYHDNTYMQNSGVDYILNTTFDVVSVLDGTVVSVKEDELVGKTVEIKHNDNYVSVYQSLSEVSVKKGDTIKQGDVIGKSGTNKLDGELGNHLHFELYIDGQVVNPASYVDKDLKEDSSKKESTNTTTENKTNEENND